ncbi:MAG: SIS domain-containing protein [Phycisphaerae bacterium]
MEFDLQYAADVIRQEASAVAGLEKLVNSETFVSACRKIRDCKGNIVISGVGKAGLIGNKISATMASVGIPSITLNPCDAPHGDLGRVNSKDIALLISYGGETSEMLRLMQLLKQLDVYCISITGGSDNPLAKNCEINLSLGKMSEACPHGLAPTVSTTCMLALGDALALTVMKAKNFTREDFAKYHPAGSLGAKLITVEQSMEFTRADELPVVPQDITISAMLDMTSKTKRRGAVMVVDESGRLSGIITDADLRRLFMVSRDNAFEKKVSDVMTADCKYVRENTLAAEAMAIFHKFRIDELPVVDADGVPVGMIDVQDIVSINLSR